MANPERRRLADDKKFRCEKCGRFASRIEDNNVVHNEVDGQDVCVPCASKTART